MPFRIRRDRCCSVTNLRRTGVACGTWRPKRNWTRIGCGIHQGTLPQLFKDRRRKRIPCARYAATNRIPIIYRVQPLTAGDFASQRPRLSLYPEYHAGIGLDFYAQLSSPIRRYADLVLQRQMLGALSGQTPSIYTVDELLTVLAGAENAEASGRELERRAGPASW